MFRTWVLTVFTDTQLAGDHTDASSLFGSKVVRIGRARSAGRLPRTCRRRHSPLGFWPAHARSSGANHRDAVTTFHPTGGEPGPVAQRSHDRQGACPDSREI